MQNPTEFWRLLDPLWKAITVIMAATVLGVMFSGAYYAGKEVVEDVADHAERLNAVEAEVDSVMYAIKDVRRTCAWPKLT